MSLASRKTVAACFALAAFAVALIAGLINSLSTAQILLRAAAAALVCYPVGCVAGAMCAHAIALHSQSIVGGLQQRKEQQSHEG